ncbi:MAG: hypothetical protein P8J87_04390, partial [Verrucomicrobiales bacterium]|nr:hypothetical protein [Verrucomicrobiales bacterium]
VAKGVAVELGRYGEISACFDPEKLSYTWVWEPGFVRFGDRRFGIVEGVEPDGERVMGCGDGVVVDAYRGYHRKGKRVVFDYTTQGVAVLDHPWSVYSRIGKIFSRTLEFPAGAEGLVLPLMDLEEELEEAESEGGDGSALFVKKDDAQKAVVRVGGGGGEAVLRANGGVLELVVKGVPEGGRVKVYQFSGNRATLSFFDAKVEMDDGPDGDDLAAMLGGGCALWADWEWSDSGELGDEPRAYVVDTIPVPLENPWDAMMFLSGHDFLADGRMAVCTIMGDVWLVDGVGATLEKVTWRRFASGLNQPLGLCVTDAGLLVLGKDQITRLRDVDGDGEADEYGNFCNGFPTSMGGHDYATGLQQDGEGNLYFATKHAGVIRVSGDGSEWETVATGFRNPNGVGVSRDGTVVTGGQEGDWVPGSSVMEVKPGKFYGYAAKKGQAIEAPLVFVPRGIDSSTSGQAFVETGGRWGAYEGGLVSLSYGAGTYYMVLRDGRGQGAVVPMEGDFLAAPNRARFSPRDGQLYVSCSDGWGDYAMQDGALHRVRYTGEAVAKPVGFELFYNGLRVDFPILLDAAAAEDLGNVFAQQWNYRYSPGYGSPEYSVLRPEEFGHDRVGVKSATLLDGGKSVFLEMPGIMPVMQLHVRMQWKTAGGEAFRAELYPTVKALGGVHEGFEPGPVGKSKELVIAMQWPGEEVVPAVDDTPGRAVVVEALSGLRYGTKEIRAKAGERLSLTLKNTDVIPHNLVLARPDTLQMVGNLANLLVADPKGVERHYVPD